MNPTPWRQIGRDVSLTRLTILIFAASFLIYAVSPQGRPLYLDLTHGAEITHVALTLVHQGDFAHPFFALPTGPTAHTAPGYVFLYALVAKLFGIGATGAVVLWGLNLGFLSLQLALLPLLSKRLGLGVAPGVLAAAFGVIVQPYRVLLEWEALFTGALLVVLCLLTLAYFQAPRDRGHSVLLGFLWGIAMLTNPECVLLLIAWPHIAAMENSPAVMRRARRAMIVALAGAALACLPWFVRNYRTFHSAFFIRDNFGRELFTSNNSCAHPTMLENFTSMPLPHASQHESGYRRRSRHRRRSPIQSRHDETSHRLDRVKSSRVRFADVAAICEVLVPVPQWPSLRGSHGYTDHFFVCRTCDDVPKTPPRRPCCWPPRYFSIPLVHYLVQFESRYRYPIFWATFLPCGIRRALEIIRMFRKSDQPHANAEEADQLAPALK